MESRLSIHYNMNRILYNGEAAEDGENTTKSARAV